MGDPAPPIKMLTNLRSRHDEQRFCTSLVSCFKRSRLAKIRFLHHVSHGALPTHFALMRQLGLDSWNARRRKSRKQLCRQNTRRFCPVVARLLLSSRVTPLLAPANRCLVAASRVAAGSAGLETTATFVASTAGARDLLPSSSNAPRFPGVAIPSYAASREHERRYVHASSLLFLRPLLNGALALFAGFYPGFSLPLFSSPTGSEEKRKKRERHNSPLFQIPRFPREWPGFLPSFVVPHRLQVLLSFPLSFSLSV